MKRVLLGALAVGLVICLAGCGSIEDQLSGVYVAPNSDGTFSQYISAMEFRDGSVTLTYTDELYASEETFYYTIEEGSGPDTGMEGTHIRIIGFSGSDDLVLNNIILEDGGNELMFTGGAGTWKRVTE